VEVESRWEKILLILLMRCFSAGSAVEGVAVVVDSIVNAVGRAAFFPKFSVFPVKYLDSNMAVFSFPPLNGSLIAVRKVQ